MNDLDNNFMQDSNTEELLKSLEAQVQSGEFSAATELLLQNRESLSPYLFHYNLGTVHVKSKHYAIGRFHLEKALRESPFSAEARNNLDFVKTKIEASEPSSDPYSFSHLVETAHLVPMEFYLVYLSILFLFLARSLSRRGFKKWVMPIIFFFILNLPVIFYFFCARNLDPAIALKEAIVREGASEVYEKSFSVKEGSKLFIGKRDGKWLYIEYPKNIAGWVSTDDVAIY